MATDAGMQRHVVTGDNFRHVVYQAPDTGRSDTLHIYIEGDGRPWSGGRREATDPTPANPLTLTLMKQDVARTAYLGRPCYFGLHKDLPCQSAYWTSARYSQRVVDSMVAAATALIDDQVKEVVLIGYSGGGTLAVLMAPRVPRLSRVITIAANLDIHAWTALHGYLPLHSSLNPMQEASLNGIAHHHFAGDRDRIVTPEIVQRFAEQHNGHFHLLVDHDHSCCWENTWPSLLQEALRITDNPLE